MAGVGSRRHCDRIIDEGRVEVNGETVRRMGSQIDPMTDTVRVDGRAVGLPRTTISLILNKPRGMLVTLDDPWGRRTVASILQDVPERLFPVGRLDKDSEGLLLLTNDGEMAHRVAHPRFGLSKTYRVTVDGRVTQNDLDRLRRGVLLGDGMARPQRASVIRSEREQSELHIVLAEGRKREIRRMLARLGFEVKSLVRTALGPLELGQLRPGEWRRLERAEIDDLRRRLGLDPQATPADSEDGR